MLLRLPIDIIRLIFSVHLSCPQSYVLRFVSKRIKQIHLEYWIKIEPSCPRCSVLPRCYSVRAAIDAAEMNFQNLVMWYVKRLRISGKVHENYRSYFNDICDHKTHLDYVRFCAGVPLRTLIDCSIIRDNFHLMMQLTACLDGTNAIRRVFLTKYEIWVIAARTSPKIFAWLVDNFIVKRRSLSARSSTLIELNTHRKVLTDVAVINGNLNTLELLNTHNILAIGNGYETAARVGNINVLDWLATRIPVAPKVFLSIFEEAKRGNLQTVQWLTKKHDVTAPFSCLRHASGSTDDIHSMRQCLFQGDARLNIWVILPEIEQFGATDDFLAYFTNTPEFIQFVQKDPSRYSTILLNWQNEGFTLPSLEDVLSKEIMILDGAL